jgi:hypothetical protein
MRRLPFVTCESDIEVFGEIGWHEVPWLSFRENLADPLDAPSD